MFLQDTTAEAEQLHKQEVVLDRRSGIGNGRAKSADDGLLLRTAELCRNCRMFDRPRGNDFLVWRDNDESLEPKREIR